MEVTPEMIDCWRVNYCLDKTPHELHEFWGYRAPSGAVLALKAACDEIESLREAVRKLMQGCEFKTIQGCEAWHRKSMPTDSALDAGRHAIGAV